MHIAPSPPPFVTLETFQCRQSIHTCRSVSCTRPCGNGTKAKKHRRAPSAMARKASAGAHNHRRRRRRWRRRTHRRRRSAMMVTMVHFFSISSPLLQELPLLTIARRRVSMDRSLGLFLIDFERRTTCYFLEEKDGSFRFVFQFFFQFLLCFTRRPFFLVSRRFSSIEIE